MSDPSFEIERKYWSENRNVVGLDEAGRGALAGPVFAAAVIFPMNFELSTRVKSFLNEYKSNLLNMGSKNNLLLIEKIDSLIDSPQYFINDSKKLDKISREIAYTFITKNAEQYAVSSVDHDEIDKINILQASQLSFRKSLDKLNLSSEHLLIDGNYFKKYKDHSFETVIKGDSKSFSIAAASILAKVTRDKFMTEALSAKYPLYGFDKHFGYATKVHFDAIKKFGETDIHRKTFLVKFNARKNQVPQQTLF